MIQLHGAIQVSVHACVHVHMHEHVYLHVHRYMYNWCNLDKLYGLYPLFGFDTVQELCKMLTKSPRRAWGKGT